MAALQKQIVSAKLVAGVDTGKDPKLVQQGLMLLENARIDRQGEIRKRIGSETFIDSQTERFVADYKDRPVLIDSKSVKVHNGATYKTGGFDPSAASGLGFTDPATLMDAHISQRIVGSSVSRCDVAESADVRVVVYSERTAVDVTHYITSYRKSNNALLDVVVAWSNASIVNMAGGIRCMYVGTRLLVIYADHTGILYRREVDVTTGAIAGAAALNSGTAWIDPLNQFDMCDMGDGSTFIVARGDTATASGDLRVICLSSLDVETTNTVALTDVQAVGCYKARTGIGVALYADAGGAPSDLRMSGWTNSCVLNNAENIIWQASGTEHCKMVVGARANDGEDGIVYFSLLDSVTAGNHPWQTHNVAVTVPSPTGVCTDTGSGLFFMGVILASRPLWEETSAEHFVMCTLPITTQPDQIGYLIIRSDKVVCGKSLQGFGLPAVVTYSPTRPHQVTTTRWRVAVPYRVAGNVSSFSSFTGVILEVDAVVSSLHTQESSESLIIPNALPLEFDGWISTELGWLWYPPWVEASTGAAGVLTGDYGYRAIYEWIDGTGRRRRSASSVVSDVTLANQQASVVVATYPTALTIKIVLYRTSANGQYYYRVGEIWNDRNNPSVTFTDNMPDTTAQAQEALYTQAQLENIAPKPFRVSTIHQDRLVYADRESEDDTLFYSQKFVPNTGIEFNEGLTLKVTPDGGAITALASYQDRLIIFKKDRIYASYGKGFSPNGGQSNYNTPQLISPTIGCTDQKLVQRIPQGLVFMSRDDIYLLDSQLTVKPFGNEVEYWTDQYTYTCSAVIPALHVMLMMSSTANAPAVVYDYLHGLWMTWTNRQVTDCAVSFDGHLYWTGPGDDTIYVEDRDVWQDDGAAVILKIRTGWFGFNQVVGYQRVYRAQLVGQNVEAIGLRLKTFFDLDPVVVDSQAFNLNDLGSQFDYDANYGAGLASSYEHKAMVLEAGVSRQQCRSIMLEITDEAYDLCEPSADPTEGYALSIVAFELGVKPKLGRKDIGPSRRY